MVTHDEFRELALSFPGTEEKPHFDRTAFKVSGKRIFATLHDENQTANLKLDPVIQPVFCSYGETAIYPVPNKWGLQGWTTFDLSIVPRELVLDALDAAYRDVLKPSVRKKGK
jgi:predicted DNA-binding protein (MmcQ/YjbR family)